MCACTATWLKLLEQCRCREIRSFTGGMSISVPVYLSLGLTLNVPFISKRLPIPAAIISNIVFIVSLCYLLFFFKQVSFNIYRFVIFSCYTFFRIFGIYSLILFVFHGVWSQYGPCVQDFRPLDEVPFAGHTGLTPMFYDSKNVWSIYF